MISMNKPSVTISRGNARNIMTGRKKALRMPSTREVTKGVHKLSCLNRRPGTAYAATKTAKVLMNHVWMNLNTGGDMPTKR